MYIPLCNRVLGQQPLVEVLQDAARAFIAPPVLSGGLGLIPGTPQYTQIHECVDQLFQQCVRPMGSLIQIAGHNVARQRDKLAHILQDLAALQEEVTFKDLFKLLLPSIFQYNRKLFRMNYQRNFFFFLGHFGHELEKSGT